MNYLIFDHPYEISKMKFITQKDYGFKVIFPTERLNSLLKINKFCKYIAKIVSCDDKVVFWYDLMAIIFSLKFKKKKIKVYALNILLKDKRTIKNFIARILYKKAFANDFFYSTVTSIKYGQYLNSILKIEHHHYLLRDPSHFKEIENSIDMNYIFCGGSNSRNWPLMIKIAQNMSNLMFHFVFNEKDYYKYKASIPKNVVVKHSINQDEFLSEIKNCSMIVMPLNTESPAGLLVFYQASIYKKMIITSNSCTNCEYFSGNRGVLCDEKLSSWIDQINHYINYVDERNMIGTNFSNFLIDYCYEDIYVDNLLSIVNER